MNISKVYIFFTKSFGICPSTNASIYTYTTYNNPNFPDQLTKLTSTKGTLDELIRTTTFALNYFWDCETQIPTLFNLINYYNHALVLKLYPNKFLCKTRHRVAFKNWTTLNRKIIYTNILRSVLKQVYTSHDIVLLVVSFHVIHIHWKIGNMPRVRFDYITSSSYSKVLTN